MCTLVNSWEIGMCKVWLLEAVGYTGRKVCILFIPHSSIHFSDRNVTFIFIEAKNTANFKIQDFTIQIGQHFLRNCFDIFLLFCLFSFIDANDHLKSIQ